jgi:hypothetical protein
MSGERQLLRPLRPVSTLPDLTLHVEARLMRGVVGRGN